MGVAHPGILVRQLRRLAEADDDRRPDAELLRAYADGRDDASFAALLRRHGPMVWHVCRRGVGCHQDAEDAFQATFLVLAKKAGAVAWRDSVAPWLFAVAQRLAARARSRARRQPPPREEPFAEDPLEAVSARDLLTGLDEEVAGLPEAYRGPVVLCLLEGVGQEAAAGRLGLSLSTLRRRLEAGKRLLRARLTGRGLCPSAAVAAAALARSAAGVPAVGSASARAAALAAAFLAPAKSWAVLAALAGVALVGVCLFALVPRPPEVRAAAPPMAAVDRLGDPLPPGAVLRLGTDRLRHGATFAALVYSADGKTLYSGGFWGRAAVSRWDVATGKEVWRITDPAGGVNALALSRDGKWLAGAGLDGAVYLWDAATGKELRRLAAHPKYARAVAFSSTGVLATAGGEGVRLWDAGKGKLLRSLAVKGGAVAVAFSVDGRAVSAGCDDKAVRVWEATTGRLTHELPGHTEMPEAVAFAHDGQALLTSGSDQTLVWDLTGRKPRRTLGGGRRAALSPDGRLLAVGGKDNAVCLWDWAAGREVRRLPSHPDWVRAIAFSPDGKTLTSASDAAAVHLHDVATGRRLSGLPGHFGRLTGVACSPDGRTIATAGWDGTVRLWDAVTGKERRCLELPDDGKRPWYDRQLPQRVGFSPDGKLVAAVLGHATLVLWDADTGKERRRFVAGSFAFSPDGKTIACGERGMEPNDPGMNRGIIRLYDLGTGKRLREMRGHLTTIHTLNYSRDGRTLLSVGHVLIGFRTGEPGESEKRFARLWDVQTGRELRAPTESGGGVKALSADGRTWASTSRGDKKVVVGETASGGVRAELTGHTEMIFAVAFSADRRTLATASMDGTVRLWALPEGKEIARLEGHRSWVLDIAFSPDGTRLVSGSLDTTGLVWDVSRHTRRPARPAVLTAQEAQRCWDDLAGDPATAYRTLARLLQDPRAAETLGRHLKPAPAPSPQRIDGLIGDLNSDSFATREQARRELEKLGDLAGPAMRRALAARPSLEVTRRLERLLERLGRDALSAEELRQVRAVEALEWLGTPAARRQLDRLAAGPAGARLTREAADSLDRLRRR